MTVLSSEDYVNDKGVFKISLFLFNVVKDLVLVCSLT